MVIYDVINHNDVVKRLPVYSAC